MPCAGDSHRQINSCRPNSRTRRLEMHCRQPSHQAVDHLSNTPIFSSAAAVPLRRVAAAKTKDIPLLLQGRRARSPETVSLRLVRGQTVARNGFTSEVCCMETLTPLITGLHSLSTENEEWPWLSVSLFICPISCCGPRLA